MKKKIIAAGILSGAIMAAAGMTAMAAQVDAAGAKNAALKHAGVSADQVVYISAERDTENGKVIYDVEFMTEDYKEYDYEISAADGSVVSFDHEAESSFYTQIPAKDRKVTVTEQKAKEIALLHAGKKASEVTFVKSRAVLEDGQSVYEVEFYTNDGVEYDYEISAYTGEVISFDRDAEDYSGSKAGNSGKKSSSAGSNGKITAEDAKKKALAKAGLSESQVRFLRVVPDQEDGRRVFEGSFYSGRTEYEFEIDAATGNFISWDAEIDD